MPSTGLWGPVDGVSIEIMPTRWRSWTAALLHAAAVEQLDTHPARTPGWTKHDAWAMSSYVSAGGLDGIGRD